MQLAFKPSEFFSELERRDKITQNAARNSYYRAINKGLLVVDETGTPRLTKAGQKALTFYKPQKLSNDARLMVIFDIPESDRFKRNHLRALLRELKFEKVQQSVWVSKYDSRVYLAAEIKEYDLERYVAIYESQPVKVDL